MKISIHTLVFLQSDHYSIIFNFYISVFYNKSRNKFTDSCCTVNFHFFTGSITFMNFYYTRYYFQFLYCFAFSVFSLITNYLHFMFYPSRFVSIQVSRQMLFVMVQIRIRGNLCSLVTSNSMQNNLK